MQSNTFENYRKFGNAPSRNPAGLVPGRNSVNGVGLNGAPDY